MKFFFVAWVGLAVVLPWIDRQKGDTFATHKAALGDSELINAVKRAKELGIGPKDVEKFVGEEATINTLRPIHRERLEMVTIVSDDCLRQSLPELVSYAFVVYWVRPIETNNPKIVGLVWSKKGDCKVFFGIGMPPV
jgi:hypothetical protein